MSEKSNGFIVGWVQSAQGIRGENFVRFYTKNPEWLGDLDAFIALKVTRECIERLKKKSTEKRVHPSEALDTQNLFINKIKPHKNGYIVKFKSIADRNQAEDLKGYLLQINEELLTDEFSEQEFYFHKVIGFELFDEKLGLCGVIKGHYNNGAHDILVLENNFSGKEVPFVDAFIVKVDFDHKKILMNLPEGLFDL